MPVILFTAFVFLVFAISLLYFVFSPFGLGAVPKALLPKQFFEKPESEDTSLTLLDGGEEAFAQILQETKTASDSVVLQIFIFKDDKIGSRVADALVDAAERGVDVTVSKDMVGTFFELGETISGRPSPVFGSGRLATHPKVDVNTGLFRPTDHSKYYIFDNSRVIFGGMNIADEYHKKWRDYMVKIDSERLASAFMAKALRGEKWPEDAPFYLASNSRKACEIKRGLLEVIENAKEKVTLLHAYFSDRDVTNALIDAGKRGVIVEVILPRNPGTHHFANLQTANRLMAGGVTVYHYPKMSHAKVAVIDDSIAVIGSSNLTHRSMKRSVEMTIFFNGGARNSFVDDLSSSVAIAKAESEKVEKPFTLSLTGKVKSFGGKYTW